MQKYASFQNYAPFSTVTFWTFCNISVITEHINYLHYTDMGGGDSLRAQWVALEDFRIGGFQFKPRPRPIFFFED